VPVSQYTMQQVIDRARIPLNDADKHRYPDADLLVYGNEALSILRRQRADLFLGNLAGGFAALDLSDLLPFDDAYVPAVADYMTARAETRDSEEELLNRATVFFGLFSRTTRGA